MQRAEQPLSLTEKTEQVDAHELLPNLSKDAEDKLVDKLVQLFLPAAEISTMKQKEYLTEKEVSLLYSVSISTLRTERCRGAGPGYVKDGRRVLYPKKTLNEYMHRRFVKTDETAG